MKEVVGSQACGTSTFGSGGGGSSGGGGGGASAGSGGTSGAITDGNGGQTGIKGSSGKVDFVSGSETEGLLNTLSTLLKRELTVAKRTSGDTISRILFGGSGLVFLDLSSLLWTDV